MNDPFPVGATVTLGPSNLSSTIERTGGGADHPTVTLVTAGGRRLIVPARLIRPTRDGKFHCEAVTDETQAADSAAVSLVAEQLDVRKRWVPTGTVRVTKSVVTEDQVVDIALQQQHVTVERVPVERFVAEPPPVREEGNVTIVSVVEEVVVVERRLMVREEIRLTRHVTETHEPHAVSLRRETAEVVRRPADRS